MLQRLRARLSLVVLGVCVALPGCGSSIEEGVPQNTGFVPVMEQPGTASMKTRPVLGSKPKAPAENPAPAKTTP
jgi:hypothetical protein